MRARRPARTGFAGSPRSRPRCSARRTAWRSICARCLSSRDCATRGFARSSERRAAPRKRRRPRLAQRQPIVRAHARHHRQDAVSGKGEVEIEIPDRLDQLPCKSDLLRASLPPPPASSCGSILPPGNAIWPGWLGSSVRRVSSTCGSGRSTTGMRTAAGRVACTPARFQRSGSRSDRRAFPRPCDRATPPARRGSAHARA